MKAISLMLLLSCSKIANICTSPQQKQTVPRASSKDEISSFIEGAIYVTHWESPLEFTPRDHKIFVPNTNHVSPTHSPYRSITAQYVSAHAPTHTYTIRFTIPSIQVNHYTIRFSTCTNTYIHNTTLYPPYTAQYVSAHAPTHYNIPSIQSPNSFLPRYLH